MGMAPEIDLNSRTASGLAKALTSPRISILLTQLRALPPLSPHPPPLSSSVLSPPNTTPVASTKRPEQQQHPEREDSSKYDVKNHRVLLFDGISAYCRPCKTQGLEGKKDQTHRTIPLPSHNSPRISTLTTLPFPSQPPPEPSSNPLPSQ